MSDFIEIGNSKFDLTKIKNLSKEDITKLNDKKLLALFEAIAGEDNIADTNEISLFAEKLKKADTNNDNKISKKELKIFNRENKEYLGNTNFDENSVAQIFDISISKSEHSTGSLQAQTDFSEDFGFREFIASLENGKSEEQIKGETIDFIENEFNTGISMVSNYDPGIISKGYNEIKEFLQSNLSKSSVIKALYVKQETSVLLDNARKGYLTKQEYYERQKQLVFDIFPEIERLDTTKREEIKKRISTLSPAELQQQVNRILELPNKDSSNYNDAIFNYLNDFTQITTVSTAFKAKGDKVSLHSTKEIKQAYEISGSEELITFEEVFRDRYGVEYNADNFEQLTEQKNQLSLMYSAQATYNQVYESLHPQISACEALQEHGTTGGNEFQKQAQADILKNKIFEILDKLGFKDDNSKTEYLSRITGINIQVKDGQFVKPHNSETKFARKDNNSIEQVTYIAKSLLKKLEENVPSDEKVKVLQDKAYYTYLNTFGDNDTTSLVQAYINDSENSVKTVRTGLEGMLGAAALISMFICPPAALAFGIGGSVAGIGLEAANEISRKNPSTDKYKELCEELATNAALFASSAGAAKTGMSAKALLIAKNCPRLVACIADVGLDVTLSLISNKILTGELNLEGESVAQILSILAGHYKAGRFGKGKISRQDLDPTKHPLGSKALEDLAKTDPELYADYQLLRSKNLLPSGTIADVFVNPKASLSATMKKDIKTMATAVRSGTKPIDSFIPQYKTINEAIQKHKAGETFSLQGTKEVYIMSETGPVKLDMDRETYFNLFPPITSAKSQQGNIGNCFMVSGFIDAAMSNPQAKALFLQKFHQKGNDIIFDVGSYYSRLKGRDFIVYDDYLPILDEMPQQVVFKDAKKRSSHISGAGLTGAMGLKIAEQATGYKYAAKDIMIYMNRNGYPEEEMREIMSELHKIFSDNNYKPSEKCMNIIKQTYKEQKVGDLFSDNKPSQLRTDLMVATDKFNALRVRMSGHGNMPHLVSTGMFELTDDAYKTGLKLTDLVDGNYSGNTRYIIGTSSNAGKNGFLDELATLFGVGERKKFTLAPNHAYRIDSIDKANRTVSIVNPWDTSKVVKLTFEQYEKYFGSNAYVVDLFKTVKSTRIDELVTRLENLGIPTKAKNGRYLDNKELLEKYFQYKENSSGIKTEKPTIIDADCNVCPQQILDRPEVKVFAEKHPDFTANYHAQLEWAGEEGLVTETINALTKLAESNLFNYNFKSALVSVRKNSSDYIFMLQKAPEIYGKLHSKGYSDSNIVQILHRLTKENYNIIKELWD